MIAVPKTSAGLLVAAVWPLARQLLRRVTQSARYVLQTA